MGDFSLFSRLSKAFLSVPLMVLLLLVLAAGNSLQAVRNLNQPAKSNPANHPSLIESYGILPLSFEANLGQSDRQVKFLSHGSGYTLFLTDHEAILALAIGNQESKLASGRSAIQNPKSETQNSLVRMKLVGANSATAASGIDELPGKTNYFIGNDPKKWRANVPMYAKVKYQNIYNGIDVIYYGNQQQLETDFVVRSGADPSRIRLRFQGGNKMEVDMALQELERASAYST